MSPTEKKGVKIAAQNRKAFHDYFVFLWENYAESDEEFEGEEQEIKELLISYTPFM